MTWRRVPREERTPLHPMAKRILLVERDYTAANPIVPAMTLGQIDYHLVQALVPRAGPVPGRERIPGQLGSHQGADDLFTLFRIVAHPNSARAYEIRDLLTRFNMPYTFYEAGSKEGYGAAPQRSGKPTRAGPIVVRHDGRVLRRSERRRGDRSPGWRYALRGKRSMTWRSWAPVPRACRRRSTRHPKVSRRSSSSARSPAGRLVPARGSATCRVSPGGSAVMT